MGYTHHYSFNKTAVTFKQEAIADIKEILLKYSDLLRMDSDKDLPPICEPDLICMDGKGEDGQDALYITPDITCASCKTDRKPYDLAVCEVLLVLKHHFKEDFELSSDGLWVSRDDLESKTAAGRWKEALQNVEQRFGYRFDLLPKVIGGDGHLYYYFVLKAL